MSNIITVNLSADEIMVAVDPARQREGRSPRAAVAEMAVAHGLHRRWDGVFLELQDWDTWKRLNKTVSRIYVRAPLPPLGSIRVLDIEPDDGVFVLVNDQKKPMFTLEGWILGADARRVGQRGVGGEPHCLVPPKLLRPCWELKKQTKKTGRLGRGDPANDFGGTGRYPQLLDSDDGRPPEQVNPSYPARWALPCRRCQTLVPVGAPATWSAKTGWIHGDAADCQATKKKRSRSDS